MDHTTCPPEAHDRSLPIDNNRVNTVDRQTVAADGLLACNDCGRPAYYCEVDNNYHHVDTTAECFLIPADKVPTPPTFCLQCMELRDPDPSVSDTKCSKSPTSEHKWSDDPAGSSAIR